MTLTQVHSSQTGFSLWKHSIALLVIKRL